ncbi:hypothetical protein L227DRAFT_387727 [Lentinus tigrinus ALCF2SS1-6]|uniref:Uncharacterized protein n=1 Tax=Lentinus tigrinus ALCF2SS1-6 TaxID=1328759 RepID=A0A5C2SJD7_9APHY|nr:hypothetical protein L227DRAFT_387727 [Lentinus tigrinus ALCF2SS1-6]
MMARQIPCTLLSYHTREAPRRTRCWQVDHSHPTITVQNRYPMSCRQSPANQAQNGITHLGLLEMAVIRFARMHHRPSGRMMEWARAQCAQRDMIEMALSTLPPHAPLTRSSIVWLRGPPGWLPFLRFFPAPGEPATPLGLVSDSCTTVCPPFVLCARSAASSTFRSARRKDGSTVEPSRRSRAKPLHYSFTYGLSLSFFFTDSRTVGQSHSSFYGLPGFRRSFP